MQPPINRDPSTETATRRLRRAMELYEEGVEITRARLRRQFPDAPPQEISRRLGDWLRSGSQADGKYLVPSPCPRFSATS
jgi:hypothetical protein